MLIYRWKLKNLKTKQDGVNKETGEIFEKKYLEIVKEWETFFVGVQKDFTLESEGLEVGLSYEFPVKVYNKYGVSQKNNKPYSILNFYLNKEESIVPA